MGKQLVAGTLNSPITLFNGLGNQFLGNIRECDAIIHVLRCFDNGNIVHVDGSVNPVRDKEIIDTELQLKDLETVENRIKRVEKIAKVGGDKAAKIEYELLLRYKDALEQGQSARTVIPQNDDEEQCAKQMFLLTTKPVLYVCNVDDVSAAGGNQYVEQVREAIKGEDAELIIISAQTEADIAELETYEEKQMFLEDLGLKESGCNRLIKAIYSLLNLETFITAGEMEINRDTFVKWSFISAMAVTGAYYDVPMGEVQKSPEARFGIHSLVFQKKVPLWAGNWVLSSKKTLWSITSK